MSTLNSSVSFCRRCQHYQAEGRRGGQCHQLGVPVQGTWKACQLAIPPFISSWETLEGIMPWDADITEEVGAPVTSLCSSRS